ncbi:MAG TPA: SCO family protein [Methylophilaceae bacterium]|jgi:protein SCO1/2|nr:SCO family protein [Methylophilaceae bacterium]
MKTALACLTVMLAAGLALAGITAAFSVFTKEQARRLQVLQNRPVLEPVTLVESQGQEFILNRAVQESGKFWLIDFIYTRCNAVCRTQGTDFQRMQRAIVAQGLQDKVSLLSISFDPAHDRPEVLARYAAHYDADPAIWRFATVKDAASLPKLLAFFGITVIPDEWGGYQHNAALLLVNPQARLVRVMDIDSEAWKPLLQQVQRSRQPERA